MYTTIFKYVIFIIAVLFCFKKTKTLWSDQNLLRNYILCREDETLQVVTTRFIADMHSYRLSLLVFCFFVFPLVNIARCIFVSLLVLCFFLFGKKIQGDFIKF